MEQTLVAVGAGFRQEILGEDLVDCLEVAYRLYRGHRVQLFTLEPIGYIDGTELVIEGGHVSQEVINKIMAQGS